MFTSEEQPSIPETQLCVTGNTWQKIFFLNRPSVELFLYSDSRRLDYSGLKFAYADGSDDEAASLTSELPSCVYAAARSRLQLPLAAYVHQHTRQLHTGQHYLYRSWNLSIQLIRSEWKPTPVYLGKGFQTNGRTHTLSFVYSWGMPPIIAAGLSTDGENISFSSSRILTGFSVLVLLFLNFCGHFMNLKIMTNNVFIF